MTPHTDFEKIVIVTRKTRLQELVERFNTKDQARFVYKQRAAARAIGAMAVAAPSRHKRGKAAAPQDDFPAFEEEDRVYREALQKLQESMDFGIKVQVIDRLFLPAFLFTPKDLVVTVGQDGLVANTAKYIGAQPLVAVNPDPARIDGILLPFTIAQAQAAVRQVLTGRARVQQVTMAEAQLENGQRLLAFNDLFIGARSHVSARYRIEFAGRDEQHSSSGVIVSTGAGSTGWLSSLFNMAAGVMSLAAHGDHRKTTAPAGLRLPLDDPRLAFVVREPFLSKTSFATIASGLVAEGSPLVLESMMPVGGVIFSDGVENDFVEFNAGMTAQIRAASQRVQLVVG
jgi:NAD kinase